MNTNSFKKAKNDFEKYFFKLMNNAVFGKTMWEHIELLNLSKKEKLFGVRIKLSYYKNFHRKFLPYRNENKTQICLNNSVILGLSIL